MATGDMKVRRRQKADFLWSGWIVLGERLATARGGERLREIDIQDVCHDIAMGAERAFGTAVVPDV